LRQFGVTDLAYPLSAIAAGVVGPTREMNQNAWTFSTLTNAPWPVRSLANWVLELDATMVHPIALYIHQGSG
jgi:hypothetical protein